jgi:hypothetical protein
MNRKERKREVRSLTVGIGGGEGHLGDDSVPAVVSKLDEEWAAVSRQVAGWRFSPLQHSLDR